MMSKSCHALTTKRRAATKEARRASVSASASSHKPKSRDPPGHRATTASLPRGKDPTAGTVNASADKVSTGRANVVKKASAPSPVSPGATLKHPENTVGSRPVVGPPSPKARKVSIAGLVSPQPGIAVTAYTPKSLSPVPAVASLPTVGKVTPPPLQKSSHAVSRPMVSVFSPQTQKKSYVVSRPVVAAFSPKPQKLSFVGSRPVVGAFSPKPRKTSYAGSRLAVDELTPKSRAAVGPSRRNSLSTKMFASTALKATMSAPTVSKRASMSTISVLPSPPLYSMPKCRKHVSALGDSSHSVGDSISRGIEWMQDSSLLSTPVFHKRLSRPAVQIQSLFRGVQARRALRQRAQIQAAVKLQAMLRGKQQERLYSQQRAARHATVNLQKVTRGMLVRLKIARTDAVTQLQRIGRGYLARLQVQVVRLERTLASIRLDHQRELEEIEEHKQVNLAPWTKKYQDIIEENWEEDEAEARKVHALIVEHRDDNRTVRAQNQDIQERNIFLAEQNKRTLELTEQMNANIAELQEAIARFEEEQGMLRHICAKFEQHKTDYEVALAVLDERIACEKKLGKLYMDAVLGMVQHVNENCSNKYLAHTIHHHARLELEKLELDTRVRA